MHKKWVPILSVIIMLALFCGPVLSMSDGKECLLVADFNNGIQNYLGGYYNKYERSPASASTFLSEEKFRGQTGQSLRIQANQKQGAFCGVWMHFFNFREDDPQYFDSIHYKYLSFWVRGEKGGEPFDVKLADAAWIVKEDSIMVAPVEQLLDGGVKTEWQEVLVPLDRMRRINREKLGGLTLNFSTPGEYVVYIDDISFKKGRTSKVPETKISKLSKKRMMAKKEMPKAIWVWNAELCLNDDSVRKDLFRLCKEEGIRDIWMQALYEDGPIGNLREYLKDENRDQQVYTLKYPEKLREFLSQAHREKLRVHALDGYPEYSQKAYHAIPLAIVDAVIAYNQSSKPNERYDGVHFDNEPYLIQGWKDVTRREGILEEFLELNAACQKRISEASDMVFGVDVPFWWDKKDDKGGKELIGNVTFRGARKPATYHCIDMLDNVGIMNYRDTADGADGMIAHGSDILKYADKAGHAKIYMGVETFSYQPTDVWFALGLPVEKFVQAAKGRAQDFHRLSRLNGFRIAVENDGMHVHVGIEIPADVNPDENPELRRTVLEVAEILGLASEPELMASSLFIRKCAMNYFSKEPGWHSPRDRDIASSTTEQMYPGFMVTRKMLPKITFAQESYEEFKKQTQAAEAYFRQYDHYAGIAIHYYDTFKDKVDEHSHAKNVKKKK